MHAFVTFQVRNSPFAMAFEGKQNIRSEIWSYNIHRASKIVSVHRNCWGCAIAFASLNIYWKPWNQMWPPTFECNRKLIFNWFCVFSIPCRSNVNMQYSAAQGSVSLRFDRNTLRTLQSDLLAHEDKEISHFWLLNIHSESTPFNYM